MRLILGPLSSLGGLLSLLVFVPFMPQVSGLPRDRVWEMAVFWLGQTLLVVGHNVACKVNVKDGAALEVLGRRSTLAGVGGVMASLVCIVAASNLLFSSVQGVGVRMPGLHSSVLYPDEFGYALACPLLIAFVLQLPLMRSAPDGALNEAPRERRLARTLLQLGVLFFLMMTLGSLLLFVADRWYAILTVLATWFSVWFFIGLAIEQLVSARSRATIYPSAVHLVDRPRPIQARSRSVF